MKKDFLADLGYLALVMRLKRISDAMIHEGRSLYRELDLDIEPNWFAVFQTDESTRATDDNRDCGFSGTFSSVGRSDCEQDDQDRISRFDQVTGRQP